MMAAAWLRMWADLCVRVGIAGLITRLCTTRACPVLALSECARGVSARNFMYGSWFVCTIVRIIFC